MCLAFPKMPQTSLAFPQKRRLRHLGINPIPPKRVKAWRDGPLRLEEINHLTRMPHSLLKSLCMKQGLVRRYLLTSPPNGQVWHKAFFTVGAGAGLEPTRVWQSQKCLRPRRHSPKEGRLRRLAINLTPPKRVKDWGDGPLRLEEINHLTRMPDSLLKSLCTKKRLVRLLQLFLVRNLYRLSLTLMLIRQINLPVSVQLKRNNKYLHRIY